MLTNVYKCVLFSDAAPAFSRSHSVDLNTEYFPGHGWISLSSTLIST